MKHVFIILIAVVFMGICMIAQEPCDCSEYVIFTFERELKDIKVDEDFSSFYFITEVNSIKEQGQPKHAFPISPLYLDSLSSYYLAKCINRDTIFVDMYGDLMGADSTYVLTLRRLLNLNKQKRRKIQEIKTKWYDENFRRRPEKVIVYALPVKGQFCQCYHRTYVDNTILEGDVYMPMPLAEFSYIPDFWDTTAGKMIRYANYIFVDFTRFIPSNMLIQDRKENIPIETWIETE